MATFKHISSKNADYGAAEAYLTFEHDEFTMKPTLDENGRLIPREDYRISSLNCGGEDFAVACMRANLRYEKNQKREDVKSHHYIISFDPRDGTDNGLTVDRAQELGEQFCKEHFPGHQALVCTHPDGHNHSGNIHVHIVINSLRIYEVPLLPYMDRPADTREGCKHRCTNAAMEYFKSEVMEMCHREGLYQIDLLSGSKERITEREYWAAKHNLKQMAATVTAYQQYGFSSPEELDEACSAAYTAMRESLTELKQMEKTLNGKKELQRQVLAYSKTRPVRDGLKQQKNAKAKAAYRQKHESDFIIADAAARYFRENGISKLPSYKALQAEIETLIQEKNSGYNDYRAKREEYRRLQTVKGNIDQILHRERKPVKRQEQER